MKQGKSIFKETLILALGEIIVSFATVGGFLLLGPFEGVSLPSIIIGASVGSAVIILNYFFLHLFVNRLIDKFLAMRGNNEMSPEELLKFTTEHSMKIQNAIKISFIVRLGSMVGALVVAFSFQAYVNPIATVIPIVAYRPILTVAEIIRKKINPAPAPNPESFITYDTDEDGYVEISDDGDEDSAGTPSDCEKESSVAPSDPPSSESTCPSQALSEGAAEDSSAPTSSEENQPQKEDNE